MASSAACQCAASPMLPGYFRVGGEGNFQTSCCRKTCGIATRLSHSAFGLAWEPRLQGKRSGCRPANAAGFGKLLNLKGSVRSHAGSNKVLPDTSPGFPASSDSAQDMLIERRLGSSFELLGAWVWNQ